MKDKHVSTRIVDYEGIPTVEIFWDDECVGAMSAPPGEQIEEFGMEIAQLDPIRVVMCGYIYMLTHSPDEFNECAKVMESPGLEDWTQRR